MHGGLRGDLPRGLAEAVGVRRRDVVVDRVVIGGGFGVA
jgi:hypothetical protein